MNKALDRIQRYDKFLKISNAVLLNGRSAEAGQEHLEEMIHKRIDKEFSKPSQHQQEIIAAIKEESLRFVKRKIKQQNDGEFFVQIGKNVREKDVHLIHKFGDKNLDVMELLVIGDTLKRSGVKAVTAYLPYLPYQRQDKKDEGRVPISSKLLFELLPVAFGPKLRRIVTFDLHARQAQGYFEGPVDELSAVPEFAAYYRDLFKKDFTLDNPKIMVWSPDAGGVPRARYLAKLLGVPYGVFDKRRIGHGEAETKFPTLEAEGMKCIFIDDIIDSAGSLVGEFEKEKIGPVQYLQSKGAEAYICATHAVFSAKNNISAEDRLQKAKVPVLITNSLPEKYAGYYHKHHDWLKVLSLDYTLAKAFYCNQVGESISAFLDHREESLKARKLDFIVENHASGFVDVAES